MKPLTQLRSTLQPDTTNLALPPICRLDKLELNFQVHLKSKNMNLQRSLVWSDFQKQELIYSILYERHIPNITVVYEPMENSSDDIILIVDGKQRLTTMLDYYHNQFSIELEGKQYYFNELPEDYQTAIKYHYVVANRYTRFDGKLTDDELIEIFDRLNYAGTPMDKEHIKKLKEKLE